MNGVIRIPEGRRAAPLGPRAPRQKTPAPATNEAQIRGEGGNKGKESVSDGVGHLRVAGDAELHQEARQGAEKRHFRGEELVLDHVEEALSMVATEGGQHGQLGERQNNTYDRSGTCTTITLAPNGAHVGCTAMFNAAPPLLLTPLGAGDRACQAGAKGGGTGVPTTTNERRTTTDLAGSAARAPNVVWQQTRVTAPSGGDTMCGNGSSAGTEW